MAAKRGRKARLKVGTRTCRGGHLVDEAHERAHLRAGDRRLRREAVGKRCDSSRYSDDTEESVNDLAVVVEDGTTPLGLRAR
jgi:hypothetical protein